ncbi:MAG: 50S ribosomal protein L24 [Thermoplasmata archaeon]
MRSSQPRKQRKSLVSAPGHALSRYMSAPLSPDLAKKYGRRNLSVRKGDQVKVVRGDYKGMEGKVKEARRRQMTVLLENVSIKKVDGTSKEVPIHVSNVTITSLDLSDERRRRLLEEGGG